MIILSLLFGLLAVSILLPVLVYLEAIKEEDRVVFTASFSPLAGLLGIGISLQQKRVLVSPLLLSRRLVSFAIPSRRRPKEKPKKEIPRRNHRRLIARIVGIGRSAWHFREPVFRFVRSAAKAFHLSRLTCDLEFGVDDPATTGKLFGWSQALGSLAERRLDLKLRPNFRERMLEGSFAISLAVEPYCLLWAGIRFGLDLGWLWVRDRIRARRTQSSEKPVAVTAGS